jgi:hypothetical protein
MRGWIQSEVPKSTTIISALVVGLSQPGRSLPQVVVSFRQLPSAGQYELTRLACPALDDITQRGNQVLRITKSLAGPDEGIPNGDDVHRTSHQLGCFCLPPHDRLSPVLFRSSVILRGYGVPALPKPLRHFSTFFAQTLPAPVLSIPNLAP